ncbi:hypothetical protein Tco_1102049 [Tanacetum coccineum]
MGDKNPIRTLGDYSRPSHEGYRNTIELLKGNNVVPLQSDTIRLVQNGCSFYRLWSEDPNQHLKDFLKLVDSLDLDGENRERTRLEDLALYDNESWNDPRDFAKPVKAIALPQDVLSTSDRRLIELKNQVQRLMEAHLALTQPTQVNKITTPCEIYSGPHDTHCCMENPEQAFVEYVSSRTNEAGVPTQRFNPELSFNNRPQNFNNQSNIEGLVSEFMASQDARLSKFKADFKQQQSERTNKIDTVLKAITNRIASTLPSDTVKNLKLGNHLVSSAHSYPTMDPECSTQIHGSINTITIHPKQPKESQVNRPEVDLEEDNSGDTNSNPHPQPNPFASISTEQVRKLNSMLKSLELVPQSSNTKFICSKEDDDEVMFIKIIRDDEPQNEDPHKVEGATTKEPVVEYFDTFPTRDELTYHRYLMSGPIPSIFLRNPIITEGCPYKLKILCNIGHAHIKKAYIDLNSPLNIMIRMMYNWIMRRKLNPKEDANGEIINIMGRIKGMHVFVGNFTYVIDIMIVEDISSILDPWLSQVVLGRPFIEISNMIHDPPKGVVRFIRGTNEVADKMPHKIEQYDSL